METTEKKKSITLNRSTLWVVIAGAFALGIFLGRGMWLFDEGQSERAALRPSGGENFAFIRPTITDMNPDQRKIRELKPFRYKVDALVREKLDDDEAVAISVYFRDLENGVLTRTQAIQARKQPPPDPQQDMFREEDL